MAQNYKGDGIADIGGELAFDLRQIYAKLVGDHLDDIAQARKADNYSVYYKTLKDLFIVVRHKIKDKKVKVYDKNKKKDVEKTKIDIYNELVDQAVAVANKYPDTWLSKNKNPDAMAEIEKALNAIEMFLYEQIDDAKMFGGAGSIPGL